jgi:hypothetical protein
MRKLRLELIIDDGTVIGISNQKTKKEFYNSYTYTTNDGYGTYVRVFEFGYLYYQRKADIIDTLHLYQKKDNSIELISKMLEWEGVSSIKELIELKKDQISSKRYKKYIRKYRNK